MKVSGTEFAVEVAVAAVVVAVAVGQVAAGC